MNESQTESPTYTTVQHEGMKISSNAGESREDVQVNLGWESPAEPESESDPQPESADSPEPPVEATPTPDTKKAPKPRNDPKARMLDATAKEAAAKRERDDARKELETLKAELAALKSAPSAMAPKPPAIAADPASRVVGGDGEPDPSDLAKYPDGQFDRKYLADLSRWSAKQEYQERETARDTATRQSAAQREADDIGRTFSERVQGSGIIWPETIGKAWSTTAILAYPEHYQKALAKGEAVGSSNGLLPINDITDVIQRSDAPKKFADHFTNHPEDLQRLLTLPRERLLAEMGRLDARLDAAVTPASAPVATPSNAPTPIRPVGGAPVATDSDDYSDDEPLWKTKQREDKARRAKLRRAS